MGLTSCFVSASCFLGSPKNMREEKLGGQFVGANFRPCSPKLEKDHFNASPQNAHQRFWHLP